jgi:peroxiredoxin
MPVGSIFITAFDSTGTELMDGKIYLDGLEQSQKTPATLENIPIGNHQVKVKVHGFVEATDSVLVLEEQIAQVSFILTPAPFGLLQVFSNPPGANVVLDLGLMDTLTPSNIMQVDAGLHTISVFMNGYITLAPSLDSIVVTPEDTFSVTFDLEAGTLGSTVGTIAHDFTLPDDYGASVSLHDYRGYIVLLTFFFSTCQPCMAEFPIIDQAYLDYAQYGVQVIGLDPMYFDQLAQVQAVRENTGVHFKLCLDWGAIFNQMCNVIVYPTNIVVSPEGMIAARMYGTDYEQLTQIFNQLLGLP